MFWLFVNILFVIFSIYDHVEQMFITYLSSVDKDTEYSISSK